MTTSNDDTRARLEAERAQLVADNNAAAGWGAAVGAREERIRWIDRVLQARHRVESGEAVAAGGTFQDRVRPWMLACFGERIANDKAERNHRFLEESLELAQACGCTAGEAHQLVDYVFGRPTGEPDQEAGGVMVTLAALCLANALDMHQAGETELERIWTKVDAIRAKQAAKPKNSPLPASPIAPDAQKAAAIDWIAAHLADSVAGQTYPDGTPDEDVMLRSAKMIFDHVRFALPPQPDEVAGMIERLRKSLASWFANGFHGEAADMSDAIDMLTRLSRPTEGATIEDYSIVRSHAGMVEALSRYEDWRPVSEPPHEVRINEGALLEFYIPGDGEDDEPSMLTTTWRDRPRDATLWCQISTPTFASAARAIRALGK